MRAAGAPPDPDPDPGGARLRSDGWAFLKGSFVLTVVAVERRALELSLTGCCGTCEQQVSLSHTRWRGRRSARGTGCFYGFFEGVLGGLPVHSPLPRAVCARHEALACVKDLSPRAGEVAR